MSARRRSRRAPTGRALAATRSGTGPTAPDALEAGLESPGTEEITVVPWPLMLQRRAKSRVEKSDRYPWIVLSAALFGLFSVGFSITVLSIALENIALEFGTSRGVLIWVITGPLLLGAIVTPSAGKLADLFGARRVYLTSMVIVAIFAGLAALSWSALSLIIFRIVGAAIGTATGPASIAIINRLFPSERRAQALGYWSLVAAGGPVLGVVIGGPVVQAVSWRWIFIAQVPLTLVTIAVCAVVFPDTERDRTVRFDFVGAILLAFGTGSFVVALNRAPEAGWGWTNPLVVGGFVLGPLLLGLFAWYERRIPHQLIPTRYLRRRNFTFPMINQFFTNFAYMGGFFLTPFLLESGLHYSEAHTGFVSIARPLAFAIAGPVAGWLATRVGERSNAIVGGLFLVASMVLFSTIVDGTSELLVIGALVLSGVGMGTTAPAMAASIANSVDDRDLGVAGGAQQMISQIGVVVGTQVMVTVQAAEAAAGSTNSYSGGYLVGAGAAALGVIAALFVRNSVRAGVDLPVPVGEPVAAEPSYAEAV